MHRTIAGADPPSRSALVALVELSEYSELARGQLVEERALEALLPLLERADTIPVEDLTAALQVQYCGTPIESCFT